MDGFGREMRYRALLGLLVGYRHGLGEVSLCRRWCRNRDSGSFDVIMPLLLCMSVDRLSIAFVDVEGSISRERLLLVERIHSRQRQRQRHLVLRKRPLCLITHKVIILRREVNTLLAPVRAIVGRSPWLLLLLLLLEGQRQTMLHRQLTLLLELSTDRNSQTTVNLTSAGQGAESDLLFQLAHGFDRVEVDGCEVVVWVVGFALPLG